MRNRADDIVIREITRFSRKVFVSAIGLLLQLAPEDEPPSEKRFREILGSPNTHFFVAEDAEGKIVGIFALCACNLMTGNVFRIEDVVVDEAQRGKGYGEMMMLFALKYAREKGAGSVDLTSRPTRIAANHLYRKLGFAARETNVYRYTFQ